MTLRQAEGPTAPAGGPGRPEEPAPTGGWSKGRVRTWAIILVVLAEILTGVVAVVVAGHDGHDAGSPGSPGSPAPPPASSVPAAAARAVVSPRGIVVPVVGVAGSGWEVTTPCGNKATLQAGRALAGADVVLDPGHSGIDVGVRGPNGLDEAMLNLAVAKEARAALTAAGLSVVLTRDADYDMQLTTRAQLALALHPRAFLSIHHNSGAVVRSPHPGTEVFYQAASADSRRLGGLVYEETTRALSAFPVAWVTAAGAGARSIPGASGQDYYGVLRRTEGITSVLAEVAYLTNRAEAELLARPEVQRAEGQAMARAIVRFLTTADPGSGYRPAGVPPRGDSGKLICRDPPL